MLRTLLVLLFLLMSAKLSKQGCTLPDETNGGYYEPRQDNYEYDEEVQFICEEGYHFVGGAKTRKCGGFPQLNSWIWSGQAPRCALDDCDIPNIPNALYEPPRMTTFGSTFTYRCNTGWSPTGTHQATCTTEATWSYTPCQEPEFHCSSPPQVNHATPNASLTKQPHSTVIEYECDSGYHPQGSAILVCEKTEWVGSLPTCEAKPYLLTTKSQPDTKEQNNFNKTVLPIIAGVVTALLLSVALTVTVLCLRRRQRKAKEQSPESTVTTPASTPEQQHQGIDLKSTASGSSGGGAVAADNSLPYHRIICPHSHLVGTTDQRKRNNYVPDASLAQFRPTVGNYEQVHSTSPSTVQSEASAADGEFHTIRECLGDFKNNNLPNTTPPPSQTLAHPPHRHRMCPNGGRFATAGPFTRTLWTADGRPYEAVTCAHGVEHVYQPLEHIYEEPHIWMRPLPNPQQ